MQHLYGEALLVAGIVIGATLLLKALLTFPVLYFKRVRCRRAFARWLLENRIEVVDRAHRFYFEGPFYGSDGGFSTGTIRLKDDAGRVRRAFVRCGDHRQGWAGRHDIEVRWDPETSASIPGLLRTWLLWMLFALLLGLAAAGGCWLVRRG